MSAIDTLVEVNISQQTSAVPTASFSIPLIIGPTTTSWESTDIVHSYTDPADMLTDGFTTGSPEYIYALELFEQAVTPTEFFVGHRSAAVAQVDTIAVNNLVVSHLYTFEINQVVISYTSQPSGDTQQSILAALLADIATQFPTNPPVTGVVTGSGSGAVLTLTSSVAGQSVSYTAVDADLTQTNTTPNHGIQDDLNAIIAKNNSWYGVILCSNTDGDILQLSALIESLKKIFIAVSSDSAIATTSTTDILSTLKGKSYKRTALIYSPGSYNLGIEAAWMGGQLPATPGSNNWAYKTLVGIDPDNISDTARNIIIGDPVAQVAGKNGNVYTTVGGVDITQMGQMVGGTYIDITIGVDWLQSTIQTNIYQALVSAAKIPYTDKGTTILMQAVKQAIDQGVVNGLIDGASPITITAPPVLSVSANQRAGRVAPTITFTCRLAGAFNSVVINGTVTV